MEDSKFAEILKQCRVGLNDDLGPPPIAISAGSYQDYDSKSQLVPMVTYGNFMFVQAPPKSAKTFFTTLLVAAYMNGKTGLLKGHGNKDKHVVHFDTEQSKYHGQRVFKRVPELCRDMLPYDTFCLRQLTVVERMEFIDKYLSSNKKVGFVVIDGIADLLYDNNDIVSSQDLVTFLMRITAIHNVALCTIIHTNYNSEKPTGHIGSFLEKKAETQVSLKREEGSNMVLVECKRSRNIPFAPFEFTIEGGLPIVFEDDMPF